jgi:hypothetical protein
MFHRKGEGMELPPRRASVRVPITNEESASVVEETVGRRQAGWESCQEAGSTALCICLEPLQPSLRLLQPNPVNRLMKPVLSLLAGALEHRTSTVLCWDLTNLLTGMWRTTCT